MRNIRLVVEYLGTDYYGWQRQPKLPTLQGILENCIAQICGEKVNLAGAGRTDAGVHALGQVANFKTDSRLHPRQWENALNALLPADIVIRKVQEVSDAFHARRSAQSKTYQYRILNRRTPSAVLGATSWHIPVPLNISAIRVGARSLLGQHDFTSFCGNAAQAKSTQARLFRLSIQHRQDLILITVNGTNFLQHMVRNIVGTLVWVGQEKIPPKSMKSILKAKDRRLAGPTAPAQGLFLLSVDYE
jgi:tRNA pseudouridine38-40 synthase